MGMFPLIYLYLIYCLAFVYCYYYYYNFIYYCHFNFSFISTNVLPLYSSYALFVNPSLREGWFLWILWIPRLQFARAIRKAFWGRIYRHFVALCCFQCVCKAHCSLVASIKRNAHILGALDLRSCRQIFMQDKKAHRNASYLPGNMIKCKGATTTMQSFWILILRNAKKP